jgi:hypothetical protein
VTEWRTVVSVRVMQWRSSVCFLISPTMLLFLIPHSSFLAYMVFGSFVCWLV